MHSKGGDVRHIGRFLLAGLVLVTLVSCRQPSPPPPASWPTGESATSGSGIPLVIYERTDGQGVLHERWEIHADGRVSGEGGQEWYLTPEALMTLMGQIEESGFEEMQDTYLPENPCDDCMVRALGVLTDTGMKMVVMIDGAPDQPPKLLELVQWVDALVRERT
jgi:hypothetical protein